MVPREVQHLGCVLLSAGMLTDMPTGLVMISAVRLGFPPHPKIASALLQRCRRQSSESAHRTLRFAPPLKSLGLVFSSLPALGQAGRSPGRFRDVLHFGKEKGEGQHLHPAVPCQGHQRAAGCSPQFLLQNGSAFPSCPLPVLLGSLHSEVSEHPRCAWPWSGQ